MDCTKVQEWLLRSDLPETGAMPADVAGHAAGCADCRTLAERLRRLEAAARAMPEPAGAEAAREAFLARLQSCGAVRSPARRMPALRVLRWSAAAAALALVATAVGLWLLSPSGTQTAETSTALDQLVEWNIEIADAATPADRGRLYSTKVDEMKRLAGEGRLPAEDLDLAGALLENGERLSHESNLVADAEDFTDVAAMFVQHIGNAVKRGDARRLKGLTRNYGRVLQRGVNAKLEALDPAGGGTPERDRALDPLIRRHAQLRDELTALLQETPDASVKEIRRALDLPAPKHHKGK
jgi:hypothetical protein